VTRLGRAIDWFDDDDAGDVTSSQARSLITNPHDWPPVRSEGSVFIQECSPG
jgi:hypothetical protein